jgi:hypothetical protein
MRNKVVIYKQDAIDAVADGLKRVFVENRDVAEILLKNVPSAQPEIILCKDCKHRPTRDEDGWLDFPTERCPCQNADDFYYSWMPKDDWFCGNAERREE